MPTIALVAGEASGDNLGAALIEALRVHYPDARFCGVAGPRMRAAGCEVFADSEQLAVMGLTEIIQHLPRLLRLRRDLVSRFAALRPDVFIGIDAPEFNLSLERRLKSCGIRTVQYVSPQVWAWRQGRVRTMGRSCDLVLCLLPFETDFYLAHGVAAKFVGHPLADQFPLVPDRDAARRELGLQKSDTVVAILPGSRISEVARLGAPFAGAAAWLNARTPQLRFVAPMVSPRIRELFAAQWADCAPQVPLQLLDGGARNALAAADAVLVASGTATLETLLSKRPMVVAYRLGAITAFVLQTLGLVKVRHFSQPNLLVGRAVVPEFFQGHVRPELLGAALQAALGADQAARDLLSREFLQVHHELRCGGAALAAAAVAALVSGRDVALTPATSS